MAVLDASTSAATSVSDDQNYFTGHPDERPAVTSVAFHPLKSALLAVALEDGRLLLWNRVTGVAKELVDNRTPSAYNLHEWRGRSVACSWLLLCSCTLRVD
jgi:hypothetical protein